MECCHFLKPPGITSHDAVGICRRILKEKRIGHSGTLDPMAYGVLPIFLGKAHVSLNTQMD